MARLEGQFTFNVRQRTSEFGTLGCSRKYRTQIVTSHITYHLLGIPPVTEFEPKSAACVMALGRATTDMV
jgi:hypothetical protein